MRYYRWHINQIRILGTPLLAFFELFFTLLLTTKSAIELTKLEFITFLNMLPIGA